MNALAQEFLSKLAAMPSATNLCSLPDHSNSRDGSSVQLQPGGGVVRLWHGPAQPIAHQPLQMISLLEVYLLKIKNVTP